jgi:hypothetical protein
MSEENNDGTYKLIVIIGTIWFLGYNLYPIVEKIIGDSFPLSLVVSWIVVFLIYRITKFIWPDLW